MYPLALTSLLTHDTYDPAPYSYSHSTAYPALPSSPTSTASSYASAPSYPPHSAEHRSPPPQGRSTKKTSSASSADDDPAKALKRQRNTDASRRFRINKKAREESLAAHASESRPPHCLLSLSASSTRLTSPHRPPNATPSPRPTSPPSREAPTRLTPERLESQVSSLKADKAALEMQVRVLMLALRGPSASTAVSAGAAGEALDMSSFGLGERWDGGRGSVSSVSSVSSSGSSAGEGASPGSV